ncbi:MAG: hypothetical protein S4CHLAM45_06490 [Chlamydiales bacterium]|nr:hypothetical protein [Chlamydiales bacterium]MCH9622761.1 hypothetical protein [Chlamydiales bacterium]
MTLKELFILIVIIVSSVHFFTSIACKATSDDKNGQAVGQISIG